MRTKSALTGRCLVITTALVSILILAACNPASEGKSEGKLRSALEKNPADAETRVELANLLSEKGSHFDAVVVLQEGTKLDPANPSFLRLLGEIYADWAGQLNSAKKYEMAAQYWQQVVDSDVADAETFRKLGHVQYEAGQYAKAIDSFAAVLRLEPEDVYSQSRSGFAYHSGGEYEKALAALTKAAELSPEDYLIWWWLGDAQRLLGDYENALASMKKARDLSPPKDRANLNEHVQATQGMLSKERGWHAYHCHRDLARRHQKLERPDREIAEHKAALEVLPLGEPRTDEHAGWSTMRIATCYKGLRHYEAALEYAQQAVEAFKRANMPDDLAYAYQSLAGTYSNLARKNEAGGKDLEEKALGARQMQEKYARQAGNQHMAIHSAAAVAEDMLDLYGVDDPRTKECRQRLAQYIPRRGPVMDCSRVNVVQTEALFRRLEEDYEGAKQLLKMVEPYYAQPSDYRHMKSGPWVYNTLGYLCWKLDDIDEAMMYGEKAVAKLSEMRSKLGVDRFKRAVGGSFWENAFSGLVSGAIYKEENTRAFDYAEQYKGRVLLDLLGSKGAEGRQNAVKRGQREKRILLARVRDLEQQVEQARSARASDNLRGIQRTLSIEETRYKRLAEDVSVADLEIKNFEDVKSMTTDELQAMADQFTVVSYVVGSQWGTSAVVLSKEHVAGVAIEGGTERKLRPLVEAFRREIGVKSTVSRDLTLEVEEKEQVSEKPEVSASEQLYEVLIEPVLPYIKTKLVYISPDSVLNHLPFEALQKSGRYLIEDFAIAYAPSASVLKICMDRERNSRESVLALGNPNLKNPAFRLVHAENEVNSLEGLFPNVDVYTGDDATEGVVQERGSEYDILHFACHGELDLDEPMLTSLRLAPDDENDGYLHAGEVFEHDLSASLVVLSACNSALGELTSGNELMGLTRSFLYAGVPSIVASLWTVDDRSTSYLMQHFYKNLATMNKADALREAKLETMKKYPSPFHWAAFCLQGDFR